MRSVAFATGLLLVLACAVLHGAASGPPARAAAPQKSPFAEPLSAPRVLAPGVISTGDDESHALLAPDGTTLYFLKNTPNFDFWTIVTRRWQAGRWSEPKVAPFSGRWSDADPFLTEDGSKLFFISIRPVDGSAREDTDLWMVERSAAGAWGTPVNLAAVNSAAAEWFPTVTRSGTLYFGSERPGGKGGADIWRSRFVDGVYQAPENVGEVNTPGGEFEPMVSPDERLMVFAAIGRAGGVSAPSTCGSATTRMAAGRNPSTCPPRSTLRDGISARDSRRMGKSCSSRARAHRAGRAIAR